MDLVDQARDEGLDVTFDMFPYPYGGTRILITFPHWTHDGGPAKIMEVLRSEEARERLRQEVQPRGRGWDEMWVTHFKQPHNRRFEGRSVAEVADLLGKHPVDAICDLLLDEELRVSYYADIADNASLPEFSTPCTWWEVTRCCWETIRHPWPTAPFLSSCRNWSGRSGGEPCRKLFAR